MKRDKTVIGRGALSLLVAALTLALGSCMQEPIRLSMPGGDGMMVRVTFPKSVATRATTADTEEGTNDENRLDRITILVFNQEGTKLETVFCEDVTSGNGSLATSHPQWATEGTLLVSPIQSPASPKKIYAVANWSKMDTEFDKDTYTETMLEAELTTITAVADMNGTGAYPMLMSGSKEVANLSSAYYSVTVDMERQASKIRTLITIPIEVQEYLPEIEWQTDLMRITVANVPNQSYVVGCGATPPDITLLNAFVAVDDGKPGVGDQTVPATRPLKWLESVYINENPVMGTTQDRKDVSTYIVVQLPYKNRITGVVDMDNYYPLYINDTHDAASPHKVMRNTIYDLSIRILGMGSPDKVVADGNVSVDGQLTVNSWEKGEMGDVEFPNHYFNIDRTHLEIKSIETSLQSTIVTNVPDWKLVDAGGTTIFSFAEGKTAKAVIEDVGYTLNGNASNATITVERPAGLIDVLVQKMTFIAKNLKVPFTVAMVMEIPPLPPVNEGFIPNWILETAGWTTNLPPTGLQVAKRGNKVQPNGAAESNDPSMIWKTSSTATLGTAAGLGMGVSSTAAMAGADHPAAQYCREMGEGWFLPSIDELMLICNNRSTLGASYLFDASNYWSATEHSSSSSNSWNVHFSIGGTGNNTKNNTFNVRCVKYI